MSEIMDACEGITLSEFLREIGQNVFVLSLHQEDSLVLVYPIKESIDCIHSLQKNHFDIKEEYWIQVVRVSANELNIRYRSKEKLEQRVEIDVNIIHKDSSIVENVDFEARKLFRQQNRLFERLRTQAD